MVWFCFCFKLVFLVGTMAKIKVLDQAGVPQFVLVFSSEPHRQTNKKNSLFFFFSLTVSVLQHRSDVGCSWQGRDAGCPAWAQPLCSFYLNSSAKRGTAFFRHVWGSSQQKSLCGGAWVMLLPQLGPEVSLKVGIKRRPKASEVQRGRSRWCVQGLRWRFSSHLVLLLDFQEQESGKTIMFDEPAGTGCSRSNNPDVCFV